MNARKNYLITGAFVAGFGVILSTVALIGIVAGFLIPPFWEPRLWLIPLSLAILSALCTVAALVLLVLGVRSVNKK
jgi:hypothetical protein